MPICLKNDPSKFERAMSNILLAIQTNDIEFIKVIIICSIIIHEHIFGLTDISKRLRKAKLKILPDELRKNEVANTEHSITKEGSES